MRSFWVGGKPLGSSDVAVKPPLESGESVCVKSPAEPFLAWTQTWLKKLRETNDREVWTKEAAEALDKLR